MNNLATIATAVIVAATLLACATPAPPTPPPAPTADIPATVRAELAKLPTATPYPTYTPAPISTLAPTYTPYPRPKPTQRPTPVPTPTRAFSDSSPASRYVNCMEQHPIEWEIFKLAARAKDMYLLGDSPQDNYVIFHRWSVQSPGTFYDLRLLLRNSTGCY